MKMPMKLNVGDVVILKKNHPCGGNIFEIKRTGMDFRIRCITCGKEVWLERPELERRIKSITTKENEN
ncbi:MAG: DUF951 domain-containing protein [Filifactoraceae bacterium]